MKKNIIRASGLILAVSLIMPLFASAQTDTSVSSQVQSLMTQIQSLQQQLHMLMLTSASSSGPGAGQGWVQHAGSTTPPMMGGDGNGTGVGNVCPQITRDLRVGLRGADVSNLQSMLAGQGFLAASSTTGYFGPATARAMAAFQHQFGISSSSTGYVGNLTRSFLKNHCNPQSRSNGMGSSTQPMMEQGANGPMRPANGMDDMWRATSTPPGMGGWQGTTTPPGMGDHGSWMNGSSTPCGAPMQPPSDFSGDGAMHTNIMIAGPCRGVPPPPMVGSTTPGWTGGYNGSATPPQVPPLPVRR